jgi:uncharacterized phage protein gp47/JayE
MGTLTDLGFTQDKLVDFQTRINSALIEAFGDGFVTTSDNPIIRVTDIIAERLALLDEGQAAVYLSQFPSSASGISLDRIAEITAVKRLVSLPTTVTAYASGTAGTVIPAGKVCSVEQTLEQFEVLFNTTLSSIPDASVTNLVQSVGVATATAAGHSFVNGDHVFIVGADQDDYNKVHLISNVTATTFDFAVSASAVSPATGTIVAKIGTELLTQALQDGPTQVLSRALNIISTPVSGWDQVENFADGITGRDTETDAELRARRVLLLASLGGGTIEAIRAKILTVSGVTSASVTQNATGVVDASGRPPHSIEAFVNGGSDTDVARALFDSVSGGIEAFGQLPSPLPSVPGYEVIDDEGISHFYKFTRLTEVLIHVYMKIVKNVDIAEGPLYPATGDDDIRTSILSYGAGLQSGQDVKVTPYIMAAIGAVPGVDLIELYVVKSTGSLPGDPANPGNLQTTIAITSTELATFQGVKIWINGATT